ncbi:signal peptidase I [Oligoflexia bacterium]|nr:signal peptidase I [Oligoflexia bacterium]
MSNEVIAWIVKLLQFGNNGVAMRESKTTDLLKRLLVGKDTKKTLVRLIVVAAAAWVTFTYLLIPMRVKGPGMAPTFKSSSLHFVNAVSYWYGTPKRDDIVAIQLAGRSVMYVSRVLALPGETVAIKDGDIYIDDMLYEGPTFKFFFRYDKVQLKADEFFIVGDNRSLAEGFYQHARIFGRVQRQRIVGSVLF